MGRYASKAHLRWPDHIAQHADAVLQWALENSEGDFKKSPLAAATALIVSNINETASQMIEHKPDGRVQSYGVRLAAVHPQTGDYLAAGDWVFGLQGMDAVWRYVADTAWQLYEGMEALPLELAYDDLASRTNTARVAMSRRQDGVAVIRVRFQWQKKREKRNLRRGAADDDVQVLWDTQDAQVNVWIGPNDDAVKMMQAERAARHPLANLE